MAQFYASKPGSPKPEGNRRGKMIVMVSLWYVYIVSHSEERILLYCQTYGTRFERLDCAADSSKNSSDSSAHDCRAGGRGFDSRGRTNTQSLKSNWEMKVLPLPCKAELLIPSRGSDDHVKWWSCLLLEDVKILSQPN